MSKLMINKKFYDKLDKNINQQVLKIYGYNSKEEFMENVISKLNQEYNFLKIDGYEFLQKEEEKIYFEYNGYIKGEFKNYDLITISFTTIFGKSGNVFFNQQVVPMITAQLSTNKDFLLDDRIKKICLLTTHKSKIMSPLMNIIDEDTTMQMSINLANSISFEFVEVIPILGLKIQSSYKSVEEMMEHLRFLQKRKTKNSQFDQIKIVDDCILAEFEKPPKGQEPKFFALKIYALIVLNTTYTIVIDDAISQTSDITIKILDEYLKYVSSFEQKRKILDRKSRINEDNVLESEDEVFLNIQIPGYKLEPETTFNSKGKKIYITKRKLKEQVMIEHNYKCACDDENHNYFIASSTKRNYLEGHHMIPMENQHLYWNEKKLNLDCTLNIIPLCPHCHNKVHKAIPVQKMEIISEIYHKYGSDLKEIDRLITLEKFASFYNVYFL